MFICTFDEKTANELNKQLKLIQKIRNNDKILYVYQYDKRIFEKFNNKEIWVSNKLYF
jgi:hypothetical protein